MKNPEIRFKNDNDDWISDRIEELFSLSQGEQIPIEQQFYNYENGMERFIRIVDLTKNDEPVRYVFPNSLKGKVNSDDVFLVRYGAVGTIGYGYEGIIANNLFKLKDKDRSMNHGYLYHVLNSPKINNRIIDISSSTTMSALNFTSFNEIELNYSSSMEVQKEISSMLSNIDNKISNEELLIKKLKDIKSSLLTKMFPQEGQSVPELRFKGYTDTWEQHKFGELVNIERGGSPRPIEAYITTEQNGLNWIKISDAPSYGNCITKTAEKIKPSGLSKTREVHPGDLILSNSMSFGKPYIISIDGCIHDGWLLINNINNVFNLKFLCTLLGTQQMFKQYKSLASGSTVNNLSKELVSNTIVCVPLLKEQKAIGKFFETFDTIISLHESKLEKLKRIKLALLNKLLV